MKETSEPEYRILEQKSSKDANFKTSSEELQMVFCSDLELEP